MGACSYELVTRGSFSVALRVALRRFDLVRVQDGKSYVRNARGPEGPKYRNSFDLEDLDQHVRRDRVGVYPPDLSTRALT